MVYERDFRKRCDLNDLKNINVIECYIQRLLFLIVFLTLSFFLWLLIVLYFVLFFIVWYGTASSRIVRYGIVSHRTVSSRLVSPRIASPRLVSSRLVSSHNFILFHVYFSYIISQALPEINWWVFANLQFYFQILFVSKSNLWCLDFHEELVRIVIGDFRTLKETSFKAEQNKVAHSYLRL